MKKKHDCGGTEYTAALGAVAEKHTSSNLVSRTITVTDCTNCPYREEYSGGRKICCGYRTVKVAKPYSDDRIGDFSKCPL